MENPIKLLLNGAKSLMSKVTNVNPNYKDTIDWKTLLTTIVENLHAVSHFKHETFDTETLYTSIFILSSAVDWNDVQGCKVYDSTSS